MSVHRVFSRDTRDLENCLRRVPLKLSITTVANSKPSQVMDTLIDHVIFLLTYLHDYCTQCTTESLLCLPFHVYMSVRPHVLFDVLYTLSWTLSTSVSIQMRFHWIISSITGYNAVWCLHSSRTLGLSIHWSCRGGKYWTVVILADWFLKKPSCR